MPVSTYTGWQLVRVQKGVRILHKISNQLSRDVAIISGSVCTDCKPKVPFVYVVLSNLCVLYIVNVAHL